MHLPLEIKNDAKDWFFYLIISNKKEIDDINAANREIKKILNEIENNISSQGINAAQYLCFYLEDMAAKMASFKEFPNTYSNINIESRKTVLFKASVKILFLLERINHLNGTHIYPKKEIIEILGPSKQKVNVEESRTHIYPKKEVLEILESRKQKVNVERSQDVEKMILEIETRENLFVKGFPMKKVIEHFDVMTRRKNRNGNVFLTREQLVSFLRRGFLDDRTQPKQKINCANGEKGLVLKRFYEFFDLAVSQYGHPQKKEKFIKLFVDCFDNWSETSIKAFFKPNKTKHTW